MSAYCILFNPLAGNGRGEKEAHRLDSVLTDRPLHYHNIIDIPDVPAFLSRVPADDRVILTGGDGTLNRFINALCGVPPERDIFYMATGSGNDFVRDLEVPDPGSPLKINDYLHHLPVVRVNGLSRRFLNGIGYGIDGYCCEEGDRIRASSRKHVNYILIACKGLLYDYHPTKATVTVDGVTKTYEHVWLSPTMNGRFYGGGIMCAPLQERLNPARTVSVMVMCVRSKWKAMMAFPSMIKGEHLGRTDVVDMLVGHHVRVEFDRPTALQIDGETIREVTSYEVDADLEGITAEELSAPRPEVSVRGSAAAERPAAV